MATEYVVFLFRRDTAANINAITLAAGEPAFCTDTKELRMGDGSTAGGVPVGGNSSVFTTTATGNQDNFDVDDAGLLVCNNATVITLRGILAGSAGKFLRIVSKGAGPVYLNNEDTNSTAANRILTRFPVTTNSLVIGAGGSAVLWYDAVAARWVVVDWTSGVPSGPLNYTQLSRTSNQSIPDGTTILEFDTSISNAWGVWSAGTPSRLTVPTGQGGLWTFSIHVYVNATGLDYCATGVLKNGVDYLFTRTLGPRSDQTCQDVLTFNISLAAGDYIEFFHYHPAGLGTKTIVIQTFSCCRLA